MKFEKAFDEVFEKFKQEEIKLDRHFAVTPSTAKILAFMWNMIAVSKNVLDDTVIISENNTIMSYPLDADNEGQKSTKSSTKKTTQNETVEGNVKE